MTLRDRTAKNLADALDFTQRRAAIDLPPYEPPPARACATGGGWLELSVSQAGWVKVICEGPAQAVCTARLTTLEGELHLADTPVKTFKEGKKVLLEMKLTDEALALLKKSAGRMPVMLETHVTGGETPACRNVFSSMLVGPP